MLGLKGPAVSTSTVCSSSLVALDAACQALMLSRCAMAMVGSTNLVLQSDSFFGYGEALAPDGRCKTFDASANGAGRGESGLGLNSQGVCGGAGWP